MLLILTNSFTALSLIVNRKNGILNYSECKYYFYHINSGPGADPASKFRGGRFP